MLEKLLEPGARIGNYILKEVVGTGAFATVWKAIHHERPGRVVVLKIATDPEFRKQLSREGGLPDIQHPNVVPILDCDTRFAEHPYVVMPYYEGGSLADLIAKHPQGLPEDRVLALLKDILGGLAAAHDHGLIHRDIKPANILLHEDGKAVLSDFGLSLANAGPDAHRSLIQSISMSGKSAPAIAGTLAYMAPELLDGTEPSRGADVYSLGVLLFEMLTGRRPAGLELPSQVRRSDMRRGDYFDRLFYWACRPVGDRYEDAARMRQAVLAGPAEIPWSQTRRTAARSEPEWSGRHSAKGGKPPPDRANWTVRIIGGIVCLTAILLISIGLRSDHTTKHKRVTQSERVAERKRLAQEEEQARDRQAAASLVSSTRPQRAEPVAAERSSSFTNSLGMEMKLIPPGVFMMGSKLSPAEVVAAYGGEGDYYEHEHPRHQVRISKPFYLSKTEVTVGQFRRFVEATGHITDAEREGSAWEYKDDKAQDVAGLSWRNPGFAQNDDHPAVCVSWYDATAFCAWLSRKEGRTYRLPTEAEWEYAARGGTTTVYWWGDAMDSTGEVANVGDTEHWNAPPPGFKNMPMDDGYKFTAPVGRYRVNNFGLHDMIGNVWEWCNDWYGPYERGLQTDPSGPAGGQDRVLRGGSWLFSALGCRCAYRGWHAPGGRITLIGFRVGSGT